MKTDKRSAFLLTGVYRSLCKALVVADFDRRWPSSWATLTDFFGLLERAADHGIERSYGPVSVPKVPQSC